MIQGVPGKPNKAGGSDNSQACQHGPKEERVACFPFPGWKLCRNSLRQETHLFLYFFCQKIPLQAQAVHWEAGSS